jgi:hypothetical protein
MTWTYEELKAADAELGIEDPEEAAAALNAQTKTVTRDVPNKKIRDIITQDLQYSGIVLLAEERDYTVTPQEIVATAIWALYFITIDGVTIAEGKNTARWDQVVSFFDVLPPVTDDSMQAIRALRTEVVPLWQPPVDAGHIQTARTL